MLDRLDLCAPNALKSGFKFAKTRAQNNVTFRKKDKLILISRLMQLDDLEDVQQVYHNVE
ncbi:MAG: hypothetical protein K0S39_3395 [Paenibacillus sp.]|jgi:transcriptional/translational regulatory protein YebC/TACO1|nr:hypothetical protein [Paenibacillus sp.]